MKVIIDIPDHYTRLLGFDSDELKTIAIAVHNSIPLEDIKSEIDKLPRIKIGNSNSPMVKYCIDESLILEVFNKYKYEKEE